MSQNKIASKLVNILSELASVPKKGYNKHQNYYYMREVDVLEALKAELIKNKIIMMTSSKLVDLKEKEKSYLTTVETSHVFLDSESGEQLTITSVGSGWDSTDKGSAKAITSACKYALMKTFMISDEGQDIENDGETVQAPQITTNRKSFTKPVVIDAGKVNNTTHTNDTVTVTLDTKGNAQVTIPGPVTAVSNDPADGNKLIDQKNIPPWLRNKKPEITTRTSFKAPTRPTAAPTSQLPVNDVNQVDPEF